MSNTKGTPNKNTVVFTALLHVTLTNIKTIWLSNIYKSSLLSTLTLATFFAGLEEHYFILWLIILCFWMVIDAHNKEITVLHVHTK